MTGDPFATKGLALPAAGLGARRPRSCRGSDAPQAAAADGTDGVGSFGDAMPQNRRGAHASNWELVVAQATPRNGRPLAVMGPQVGYYLPQILMEHGPARPRHRRPRCGVRRA